MAYLIRFLTAVLAAAGRRLADPVDRELLEASLLAVMPLLIEEAAEPQPPSAKGTPARGPGDLVGTGALPARRTLAAHRNRAQDACRSWPTLARVISEAATVGGAEARGLTELSLLAAARNSESGTRF